MTTSSPRDESVQIEEDRQRNTIRTGLTAWAIRVLAPTGLAPAAHHKLLLKELEAVARTQADRLIVLMPPGAAKSTYTSVIFPAWWFAQYPSSSVIAASHTAGLAEHFSRQVRGLITEDGSGLGTTLVEKKQPLRDWRLATGGHYFATGIRGPTAGRRADLIIIDDPIKSRAEADSASARQMAWNWFRFDLLTRLTPGGRIVLVSNLTSSTPYDFQVVAVNSAGSSAPSTVANATTTIAVPGTPTNLTASALAQTTAILSWGVPSGGGAVGSYTLQYRVTGTSSWTQVTGVTGTSSMVTGLTAATQYDFQVAALNAAGASSFTTTTNATTLVAVPGLPTGLTAAPTAATNTTQPLSWTPPSSGGAVASYSVRYSAHSANVWSSVTGITGISTAITGLTPGTSYDYEVEAVNAGGNSGWTTAITASTPNYYLTHYAPASGYTASHTTNAIIAQVNDNSVPSDGTHTVPASVNVAWSSSNSLAPSTGFQAAGVYYDTQLVPPQNLWGAYANGPPAAGTYYLWGFAYDAAGTLVATCVSPFGFVFT